MSTLNKPDQEHYVVARIQEQMPDKQLSVVDRYFTRRYRVDNNGETAEDQCILSHSNRICIIAVAPSHPMLKTTVTGVSFQVTDDVNRLENKVSGKSKRGAQWLKPKSALCIVTCDNGQQYTLNSCMRGQLIEVNENLLQNPRLLTEKPLTEGYVAIVLPVLHDYEREMSKLLSEADYQGVLAQRLGL
ncbi:protein Abitram-like isoform X2 [Gigantopelta aegis]|uniref:protein Abitram-like isoform X2 n=1 Tax=Gigantopelta aegis TaxID=1735272 RepID=UPI001B88CA35|nr:protein Abitram-like isoform X2 [Gigantopelta aegis]